MRVDDDLLQVCQTGLTSAPPETAETNVAIAFASRLQFDLVHAFLEQTISQNLPCVHGSQSFRVLTATASRRLLRRHC